MPCKPPEAAGPIQYATRRGRLRTRNAGIARPENTDSKHKSDKSEAGKGPIAVNARPPAGLRRRLAGYRKRRLQAATHDLSKGRADERRGLTPWTAKGTCANSNSFSRLSFRFQGFGGFYADDLPFSRDFACAWIVSCVRAAAPGNGGRNNRASSVDSGPAFCFRYRGGAEVRSGGSHGWSKRADRHGSKRLPSCTAGQSRRQCAPDGFGSRIERSRRRRHFDENGQGRAVRGGRPGDRRIYHLCRDTRWGLEPKETLARAAVDRKTSAANHSGITTSQGAN